MRTLRALLASLLTASLLLAPTGALTSDFSMMGHPSLIRSLIMGLKERRAIRCLERWTESGEREGLGPLAEAIVDRTTISLGFPNLVRAALRFERRVEKPMPVELPNEFGDDAGPLEADSAAETMPAECTLLATTYRHHGLEAALAMLGQAPAGTIPLPSPGTCIALLKSRGQADAHAMRSYLAEVRLAPDARLPAAERDRILADVAAYRADSEIAFGTPTRTLPVADTDWAELLCLGSLVDLEIRLWPERARPYERPHRELYLFRYGNGLLTQLDADLAAHPEWLNDPVKREALGLFEPPAPSPTE